LPKAGGPKKGRGEHRNVERGSAFRRPARGTRLKKSPNKKKTGKKQRKKKFGTQLQMGRETTRNRDGRIRVTIQSDRESPRQRAELTKKKRKNSRLWL